MTVKRARDFEAIRNSHTKQALQITIDQPDTLSYKTSRQTDRKIKD